MSVFEYTDDAEDSHTTIREKDKIFSELYKSEHMRNAGPYARLKFAMDYWCALWFWPIDKAELLPSRSEFLFDMSLILEGTTQAVLVTDVETDKKQTKGQLSLFPTEMQQLEFKILDQYDGMGLVDIPALRKQEPRLDLAARIAEQNKFMHWELEFADLFAECGGFDLIIGNPPWITMEWKIKDVISDFLPIVYIQNLDNQIIENMQIQAFSVPYEKAIIMSEYENVFGQQIFLDAIQNYPELKGIKPDLYKAFLPKSWYLCSEKGIIGLLHPEGVYDDAKGGEFRRLIFRRLREHYQFINQKKLFPIGNTRTYSINIYSFERSPLFDAIYYLFDPRTISDAYEIEYDQKVSFGIKNADGNWNEYGDNSRIIHVTWESLKSFIGLLDEEKDWQKVRMPMLYSEEILTAIRNITGCTTTINDIEKSIEYSEMLTEPKGTGALVKLKTRFALSWNDLILCGPNIGIANPFFKTPRAICNTQKAFDPLDLSAIKDGYYPRTKYSYVEDADRVYSSAVCDENGIAMTSFYRIVLRKMVDKNTERSLISTIIPPLVAHMDSLYSILIHDQKKMVLVESGFSSIIHDFLVKMSGKSNLRLDLLGNLPICVDCLTNERILRILLLNCVNDGYQQLWKNCWDNKYLQDNWTGADDRLPCTTFTKLTADWNINYLVTSDFARRQLLVENDVLTAISLGMTLNELQTIYRLYFPVLKQYEADTWYDANGRITFTNNRSLTGVGFSRPEWENAGAVQPVRRSDAPWDGVMKYAPAGYVFARTIMDDTMPGGPVERTIEYVAPFDHCDREQDYETAWKFFEKKYKNDK